MNSVLKSWCFLKPVITSVIHTLISAIYPGATKPFNAIDMSRVSHLSKS